MREDLFFVHTGTESPDSIMLDKCQPYDKIPCWNCGEKIYAKDALKDKTNHPYCSQKCAVTVKL